VSIRHRNHIAVLTPQLVPVINGTLTYDFRANDSYHNAASAGQKQTPDGAYVMYAGDIDPTDAGGYDINGQDKGKWSDDNGTFGAYLPSDINLDGDVNGADKIFWENNNGVNSIVPK